MTVSAPPSATIDEIRAPDLAEVAALIHTEATGSAPSSNDAAQITERMRWLLADNPANQPDIPWGWLLRDDSSSVVGAMVCVPQRFTFQGQVTTALMSAKWFVNERFRGGGLGIFLKYLKLGRKHPLFATTAGAQSAPLWQKFNAYAINDSDHECIGARRMSPLVEEAAFRRLKKPALARIAGAVAMLAPHGLRRARSPSGSSIDIVSSAAEVIGVGAAVPQDAVTAVRDAAFVAWRHFTGPDAATREVLALRLPSGGVLVAVVGFDLRGYRRQTRTLSVLDLWGDCQPTDMPAIAGLLARRYASRFDMMVFRSQPPARQAALQQAGFMRRTFESPVAWCIDAQNVFPSRNWYLVPADAE